MKFFYTASHFETEIAKKEKELQELRRLAEHARVREFHRHITNRLHNMDDEFHETEWTISFGSQSITLPNYAEVFQGIEQTIVDYMEDEGIEYNKGESNDDFVIVDNNFEYTGGGVWVLFSEIWLPNEETTIYATTDDSYCFFYYNKEDFDKCENPDYEIYCDNIEDAAPKYLDIAKELFAQFERDLAKERG